MEQNHKLSNDKLIWKLTSKELEDYQVSQLKSLSEGIGYPNPSKNREYLEHFLTEQISPIVEKIIQAKIAKDPSYSSINPYQALNPIIRRIVANYEDSRRAERLLNKSIPKTPKCICEGNFDKVFQNDVIQCINKKCGRILHRQCLKLKSKKEDYPLFECPSCVLSKCDPLHEIQETLIPPFLVDNKTKAFTLSYKLYESMEKSLRYAVEVRSIKLEDKSHEQCWPNTGEMRINYKKVMEFKPLQQNSSLKKRKDEKFFTNIDIKVGPNTFDLYYRRDSLSKKNEETYVAAVYFVEILTAEELVKKIKQENRRDIEECKKLIMADFKNSVLDIDMLSYPPTCVFDMQLLKTPAKGAHCKHANCFSLENFVSVWQKNNQRKWMCPICKLKSYDLIVDTYFEKIMSEFKEATFEDPTSVSIEIRRDASYKFVKDNDSIKSEEEERASSKQNKNVEKIPNIVILDESDEEEEVREPSPRNIVPPPTSTEINQTQNQSSTMLIEQEGSADQAIALEQNKTPRSQIETEYVNETEIVRVNENTQDKNGVSNMIEEPIQNQTFSQAKSPILTQTQSPNHIIPINQSIPIITQVSVVQIPPLRTYNQQYQVPQQSQPFQLYPLPFQQTSFYQTQEQFQNNFNWSLNLPNKMQQNTVNNFPNGSHVFQPLLYPSATEIYNTLISTNSQNNFNQVTSINENAMANGTSLPFGLVDVSQIQKEILAKSKNIASTSTEKSVKTSKSRKDGSSQNQEKVEIKKTPISEESKKEINNKIVDLLECIDKKLELPTMDNFKTKTFANSNVDKEKSLQLNKKLLSLIMKHVPIKKQEPPQLTQTPQPQKVVRKEADVIKEIQNIRSEVTQKPNFDPKPTIPSFPLPRVENQILLGNGGEANPICLD